jgi:hypothetical protein
MLNQGPLRDIMPSGQRPQQRMTWPIRPALAFKPTMPSIELGMLLDRGQAHQRQLGRSKPTQHVREPSIDIERRNRPLRRRFTRRLRLDSSLQHAQMPASAL